MYNWESLFNLICAKYTGESLKEKYGHYMENFVKKLKIENKVLYDELMNGLYIMVYGEHFNAETAKKAVESMENEDGTTGAHWSLEDTTKVAQQNNINLPTAKYNEYDWYFVLNMIYSDFCKVFGQDINLYIKVALAWLEDKDAANGKAYKYYQSVKKNGV